MNDLYNFSHTHDHHCQPSIYLITPWNTKYPKISHIVWEICVGCTSRHHTYISDLYCTIFYIYFIFLIFQVSVFLLTVFEALQLHFVVRWQTFDQNNYQQDDTYGLSFILGLVFLHSTCFELQGAHHQEFTFLLYRQPLAYCVL